MNRSASTSSRRDAFDRLIEVERVGEARAAVQTDPNLLVLVRRDYFRNAVMHCPCGCGELLVVNLDPEAGPSWRVRVQGGSLTLMPSVWRDSGCHSHFVLWENHVWWCGSDGMLPEDTAWPQVVCVTLRGWWRRMRRTARRK